jgi:Spy/CpxP family protein refolding chaperone
MKSVGIAALLWLAAASALAQDPGERMPGFEPGARLEENLRELDLEPAKLEEILALIADSRREGEAQREQLRGALQEMRALLETDLPDEAAVMAQAEQIGELRTEAQKAMLHTLLAVRAQLTPEQREQLRSNMREDVREDFRERRSRRFRR